MPLIAAPTARPTSADSEIGVSRHAPLAELLHQAARHAVSAAEQRDIFAHDEHALVARHLVAERLAQGFLHAHLFGGSLRFRRH